MASSSETESYFEVASEIRSAARRNLVRIDQLNGLVTLRYLAEGRLWEMLIPDETVRLVNVRVSIQEFSERRGYEASFLVPWEQYRSARDWLRCVPDGYCSPKELEPALKQFEGFLSPLIAAMRLEISDGSAENS